MNESQALCLKALILCAEKLPKEALPHLGPLAVWGIVLDDKSRSQFFEAFSCLFGGHGPHAQQKGRKHLFRINIGDDGRQSVIENIECLRQAMNSPEHCIATDKFFTLLKDAEVLRHYYHYVLYPDGFRATDEDAEQSLFASTAYLGGGLVSHLLNGENLPLVRKRPSGPPVRNADIEAFVVKARVNENKPWKEVKRLAKAKFCDRITSEGQLRKLLERYRKRQKV